MPALRLCGHRTLFAGDDLRNYSFVKVSMRVLQLCLATALMVFTAQQYNHNKEFDLSEQECEGDLINQGMWILFAYDGIAIFLSLIGLGTFITIYMLAGRGNPTDSEPRALIPVLCNFNLYVITYFQVSSFILGGLSLNLLPGFCSCLTDQLKISDLVDIPDDEAACPQYSAWLTVLTISAVMHLIDFINVVLFLMYLLHATTDPFSEPGSEKCWKIKLKCFIGCCSSLSCCILGGPKAMRGDLSDISFLLSNFFNTNGILDITPSDVAAGLVMVRRETKVEAISTRRYISEQREVSSASYRNDSKPDAKKTLIHSLPLRRQLSSGSSKLSLNSKPSASEGSLGQNVSLAGIQKLKMYRCISEPRAEHLSGHQQGVMSERAVLVKEHQRDLYLIREGARFAKYAAAVYSWFGIFCDNGSNGILSVFQICWIMLRSCFLSRPSRNKYAPNPCLQLHRVSLLSLGELQEENVVYATFHQYIQDTPYMIALDHEWKSVVISIRGSQTFESLIADITVNPVELVELGNECGFDGTGKFCHRGILACTEWIYRDLKKHGKLDYLLGPSGDYKNYRLRIVGHSLGAGCASVLSVLLRPKYPNLRCLAFSPPGCVFSANLAEECSEWTTSFVINSDLIPRLSKESLEMLRNDILKMIARIKVPKYKVLNILRFHQKNEQKSEQSLSAANAAVLCDRDAVVSSEFRQRLDQFLQFQEELKRKDASKYIELFLPGELVHLLGGAINGGTKHDYTARWAKRLDFRHVVVSTKMFCDHIPTNVKKALEDIASSQFDLSSPYTPDQDASEHASC